MEIINEKIIAYYNQHEERHASHTSPTPTMATITRDDNSGITNSAWKAIITNYSENQNYVFLWKLKPEFFEILNKENNIITSWGLITFSGWLFQFDFSSHVNSEENRGNWGILIHHPLMAVQSCLIKQLSERCLDVLW